MKTIFQLFGALALSTLLVNSASADLVLDFSGDVGSSVVNWVASGSITITEATAAASSSVGAAPNGGAWDTGFDNNLGDLFQPAAASDNNVALSGSGISYLLNSVEFETFETIDFGPTATAGGDDLQPDPLGTASYPALAIGAVVSWSGSGTLTLTTETYDTFFLGGSQGISALDGGNYVVNIAVATIPEPSSAGLVCLGVMGWVARRRRS